MTTAWIDFVLSCYELTNYSLHVPTNTVALEDLDNIPVAEHGNHDCSRPPDTNQTLTPVLDDAAEAMSYAMPRNAMRETVSSDPDVITTPSQFTTDCGQWDGSPGDLADLSEVHSNLSCPSPTSFVPSSYHSRSSSDPYTPPNWTPHALARDINDWGHYDLSSQLSCPGSKWHNGETPPIEMADRFTLYPSTPATSLGQPASPSGNDKSKSTKDRRGNKAKKRLQAPFLTDRPPTQPDEAPWDNNHSFRLQGREAEINKIPIFEDTTKGEHGDAPLSSSNQLYERGGESQGNLLLTGPQRGTKRPRDEEPAVPDADEKKEPKSKPSRQSALSPPWKRPAGKSVKQEKVWGFVHYPSPQTDSGKQRKRKRT